MTIDVLEPLPDDPGGLNLSTSCTPNGYQVELTWEDKADNEEGYRVYREGERIKTLGEDAENYSDNPSFGGPYDYAVEAFNDSGASGRSKAQAPECASP